MLGGQQETGSDASNEQADEGGLLHVSIEGIYAGQKEERDADVGGDQCRVGQDVGIEDGQHQSDERGGRAKPLACGNEDQERERQSQQPGGEPHAKDEPLACTIVAGQKIAAVNVGFGLEIAVLQRRGPQVPAEQGQRGQQLDQRRVLGIKAVVAGVNHHVAGEDVIVFVEGERLSMDDESYLRCLHGQQSDDCEPDPSSWNPHGGW